MAELKVPSFVIRLWEADVKGGRKGGRAFSILKDKQNVASVLPPVTSGFKIIGLKWTTFVYFLTQNAAN